MLKPSLSGATLAIGTVAALAGLATVSASRGGSRSTGLDTVKLDGLIKKHERWLSWTPKGHGGGRYSQRYPTYDLAAAWELQLSKDPHYKRLSVSERPSRGNVRARDTLNASHWLMPSGLLSKYMQIRIVLGGHQVLVLTDRASTTTSVTIPINLLPPGVQRRIATLSLISRLLKKDTARSICWVDPDAKLPVLDALARQALQADDIYVGVEIYEEIAWLVHLRDDIDLG